METKKNITISSKKKIKSTLCDRKWMQKDRSKLVTNMTKIASHFDSSWHFHVETCLNNLMHKVPIGCQYMKIGLKCVVFGQSLKQLNTFHLSLDFCTNSLSHSEYLQSNFKIYLYIQKRFKAYCLMVLY